VRTAIPTLNEYVKVERAPRHGRHAANSLKQKTEDGIMRAILAANIGKFEKVKLHYLWFRRHRREDGDNIAFGQKFVQDALVRVGTLPNDGQKNVAGFSHFFPVDKDDPRLELFIESIDDE
jgi:Holliday junction resolvase RusA-like endonuclease